MTPPVPDEPIIVEVVGRTDVGRCRRQNEDTCCVADLSVGGDTSSTTETRSRLVWPMRPLGARGMLFLVADGMGGAAAGEVASGMASRVILEEMRARWSDSGATDPDEFAHSLRRATERANERIHAHATAHPETRGMGTTVTLAGLLGDTLYLCQVGDSRAYLIRRGVATQITKDQSLIQRLIEAGELTGEEAERSERRNIILQALGPDQRVAVDLTVQRVQRGDHLVLCSDGLSGQVGGPDMVLLLAAAPSLDAGCDALIDRANATGGPDNITALVVRLEGAGLPPTLSDAPRHQVYAVPPSDRPTVPIDAVAITSVGHAASEATTAPRMVPPRKRITPTPDASLAPSLAVFAILVLILVALGVLLS